ncbi:MAG: helix-turn-helix domain-containing protein [Clostridia bacterium]|nr:helix-turn-helix domain-containing protein [Clostridia bacterium]
MSLQEILKITRQKAFMSQEAFADKLCVSVATINRWENGKSKPNLTALKNIKQFCEEYNLSYSEIEDEWFSFKAEGNKHD